MKRFRISAVAGNAEETIVNAISKGVAIGIFSENKGLDWREVRGSSNQFALYIDQGVTFEDDSRPGEMQYRIEEIE